MKSIIQDINNKIKNKEESITQIVSAYVNVLKERDVEIGAMLEIFDEEYISGQIKIAERMFELGTATLMTGVPIVIKDNICIDGRIVSAGSKMLENYTSTYDASVIKKLKAAGAVIVGRANMDEFAMGGSTENSAYKNTKNPLDITRVPGGSSGGSAAAVAMLGVPVSLGSDTGGSVRQPASFTGLVGLKPTYGSVSRYGLIAMGSSLDVIGTFSHNVRDSEILFDIIKGEDDKDATTIKNSELKYLKSQELTKNKLENNEKLEIKKLRIGVPRKFIDQDGVDKNIRDNFYASLEILKSKGYEIIDIDINNIEKALSVYYVLMFAEVSSNLARFDGVRYGKNIPGEKPEDSMILSRSQFLGDEPIRRSLMGAYVLSSGYYDAYYNKAIKMRDYLKLEFTKVFESVDLIATPTSPVFAWKFGEKSDPLSMYLADIFTVPANIVGVPGISIPTGKVELEEYKNLNYGVQFLASWHNESKLFTTGYDLEA